MFYMLSMLVMHVRYYFFALLPLFIVLNASAYPKTSENQFSHIYHYYHVRRHIGVSSTL